MWMCALFGIVCASAAATAFVGATSVPDAVERDASIGFGWFWTFLAVVAAVFGVLSWMIKNGRLGPVE